MPLAPGQKLGPYEVVAPLGAGGMGEVWRARDTRLGRDVAIKVLPPGLADDHERRTRFEREARAVAALNHPNICVIHDVGRTPDGTDYLVMELVEGESLAERIARGPLPLSDTLRIGAEIADALERAHRAGIVHRDLKPANVMLAKSGAKLMDFGLARAGIVGAGGSGTQLATATAPITGEGRLLGTVQYMSPEQLEGRDADARSDIWALGLVLYEMATGQRAFEGASTASLIGAIMRDEPRPLAERAPASPPALERVIRTCLAKEPDQRWQSAGDVGRMLRGLDASPSGAPLAAAPAPPRARLALREAIAWGLTLALPIAVFVLARVLAAPPRSAGVMRTALTLPRGAVYHFSGDFAGPPAISPDGRRIAFVALDDKTGTSLWVRNLDRLDAQPIPGTEGGSFPFWSPDGASLGFCTGVSLKRVDLESGSVVTLCGSTGMRGGSWSRDGSIVFTPEPRSGIFRVPASGGMPVAITTPDSAIETTERFPQLLPDGRHILYFSGDHRDQSSKASGVYVMERDGKGRRKLLDSSGNAVYANGYLLYLRDSLLFARPFDPGSLRFTGEPIATREHVQPDPSTWASNLSASENGRLAYVIVGPTFGSRIEERTRDGSRVRALTGSANQTTLYLSRDGRTLAQASQELASADIWLIDVATGRRTDVIAGPSDDDAPALSPRADRMLFVSNRRGPHYEMFEQRSDGAGDARLVLSGGEDRWPVDWSADGRFALVQAGNVTSLVWDSLLAVTLPAGAPAWSLKRPGSIGDARLSPDGRWLAYSEGGFTRSQVFIVAFPPGWPTGTAPEGRWQASAPVAFNPRWRADGHELVFARADGTVTAVDVQAGPEGVKTGAERTLFHAPLRPQTSSLEMSPNGQRFYVNVLSGDDVSRLAIVDHWMSDLPRK